MHPRRPKGTEDRSERDWVRSLIATRCDALVSDHPSLSERLGLEAEHAVTLRFIANRNRCHCFIFSVHGDAEQWPDAQARMTASVSAAETFAAARARLGSKTFLLMTCPRTRHRFRVSSDLRRFFDVSTAELQKILCRIHPGLGHDAVGPQETSEASRDSLLGWAEAHLARSAGLYRMDAVQLAPHPALYTLRPTPDDASTWRPSPSEEAAYAAMLRVASERGLSLRVVAYDDEAGNSAPRGRVALHLIKKTGRGPADSSPPWIEGEQLLCPPENILLASPGPVESRTRYRAAST